MSLPRYSSYRDSGLDAFGKVPDHWNMTRLRFVATLNPSKSEVANLDKEALVSFLPMDSIGDDGSINLDKVRPISQVETGYTFFRDGDVTLAKITPCFENGKGAIMRGLLGGVGFGTTELVVARPIVGQTISEYLHWIFVSSNFRKLGEGAMYGAGGQKRISDDFVRNFAVAIPPLEEQFAIATFLDRETTKIDALVSEQEKLIALLEEKRQATITHAVTKGLNPNAPMKESGVEWLGKVPEHWSVTRLKYAMSHVVDCPHDTPVYDVDGSFCVVRTADISLGRFHADNTYRVDESEYRNRIRRLDVVKDDIVYGREGERWGFAALVPEDRLYCLGQRMMQFRAAEKISANFMMWQLNAVSTYRQGQIDTVGATAPHVNVGTIRNYILTQPPLAEQMAIASFLLDETRRLDALAGKASEGIKLLNERRNALISAAVTGKIDVRQVVQQQQSTMQEAA